MSVINLNSNKKYIINIKDVIIPTKTLTIIGKTIEFNTPVHPKIRKNNMNSERTKGIIVIAE